jgi:putative glutamine transport system substrate-binding protein
MKRLLAIICALAVVFSLAGCSGATNSTSTIKKANILRVGVKEDVPGFGLLNQATGQYEGMEIDIARLIAKEILGDESLVIFQPVTAKTRGPLLETGDIDMVIATFTINEERKLSYNFTTSYYTDAVGLLVKKANGYTGLADLGGKTIGVAQSATSKDAIQAAADEIGISVSFSEFGSYPEIKAALDSGRVDAFSVDRSILSGYLDDTSEILPDRFSPQEYGIATKLQNKELASAVEGMIVKWLGDGTIQGLISKYNL